MSITAHKSTNIENRGKADPITGQPLDRNRIALDILPIARYKLAINQAVTSNGTTTTIPSIGHQARRGDIILFEFLSVNAAKETFVLSTTTNSITLADSLPAACVAGDTYTIYRPAYPVVDSQGQIIIPLPSGAATAANQATEISYLADIDAYIQSYLVNLANLINCNTSAISGTVQTYTANTGILDNRKTVTTAGTRVTLAASTACKRVDVQALATNTDVVCVGGTTVVAASGSRTGMALNPGDVYSIEISNLNSVNLDSVVNGEGVSFVYYT